MIRTLVAGCSHIIMVESHHSRLLWFKFGLSPAAGTQHFSEAMEEAMELSASSLRPLVTQVNLGCK